MRSGRGLGLAAAIVAVGASVVPALVGPGRAGADLDAVSLVRAARASTATFSGVVEVQWRDRGLHRARVSARSVGGSFVVGAGETRVVGDGPLRWAAESSAPGVGWKAPAARTAAPDPDDWWDLTTGAATEVAGRAAITVVARDARGRVRARFAFDRASGQLLRTEVLDRQQRVSRAVGFVELSSGPTATITEVPDGSRSPTMLTSTPEGLVSPSRMASAYELTGRYQHDDGWVQLYYADGLFGLSIFERRGELDWSSLPSGRDEDVDGIRTRLYVTAAGTVRVWSDGGTVFSAVADGPDEVTVLAVRDARRELDRHRGTVREIVDWVLSPFGWD